MTISALNAGIQLALATTREHKLRSFLTVLGVIIGTGAVIGVGSIIAGLDGAVSASINSFGPETMLVRKAPPMSAWTPEERRRKPLTHEDAVAIAERCPSVQWVSPMLWPENGIHKARYKGNDKYGIQLFGTGEAYTASGVTLKAGRFFTDQESLHRAPVTVVGETIGSSWFPDRDPIGKWIEVDGHSFEIIGVMERPAASMPGQEDARILLPYFSMRKMFPAAREHTLTVTARPGSLARAQDEVRAVLRLQRRVKPGQLDNFSISTAEQMIEQFRSITSTVATVMIILSSIGLLVGGIGVMNIMLVSVTERTREIGIRKAVGARRSDIVLQFLTEAVVLTFLGGLIGMFLGWLISRGVGLIFPGLPTAVPLESIVAGVLVSVGVGLFFGIWPAGRAARLDPVDALRYE